MNLNVLRQKINKLDREIIASLGKRQALMPLVAKYKKENNLPVFQKDRETEILVKLSELAVKKKLDPKFIQKIYKLIFAESRKHQRKIFDRIKR